TGFDHYRYDPLDARAGLGEALDFERYLVDQSKILLNPANALIYHTQPFEQDTELAGFFRLEAWLEMDQPDTDFDVNVYEILPDGSSVLLGGEIMRARYRDSLREGRPV